MKIKKQMQLLGLLNPAETPELKSAVTAIGNANTEAEIADILNGFTVKFIKTLANYEAIWNINGLKKSELVAKISRVIAARFNAINHRNIFRDYSPIDKVYLMRTQGITPDYIWNRNNWDKDNSDKSDPKYSACTYKLPNDDSQHELPATADDAISATGNDSALASQPAAVANAESSQPEALYIDDSYSDAPGDNSCPDMDIPGEYVPDDTEKKQEFFADDSYMRNKPYVAARLIFKPGHKFCDYDGIVYTVISRSKSFITFRDNKGNTIRRKPAAFVLVNSLYDTYAEMVYIGNNHYRAKCKTLKANMVFIPDEAQTEIPATAEISQPENLYMDDSFSDAPGDNSECARNQDFPVDFPECTHAEISQPDLSAPVDNNPLHHLKPCPACHSTHIPFLKRCDDNNFSTATRRFNGGIARQHIYYRLKCRDCGHEVIATIFRSVGDGFVIPHQNEADVKKKVFQNWDSQYTENPGFTIVPSEHIERPQYTTYPDTITDECPYVTVPACDIPENHSHAAVVPYNQASGIRYFFRLIAIYLRLWFASHIIPADFVFPVKIKHSYFSVGFKYPAWINHKKQFLTVTDRKILDNGRLDVRVNDEENGSFGFTPWTDERGNEYTYFPRWSEFCYASQGVRVKRRSNAIKFNLGLTYPALRNNRLYANATVIAFDDTYSKDKNGKIKLTRHDIIFRTDCEEKSFKHIQTWTRIENGVELAEYNVYPSFNLSADCPSLGSKSPELPSITPLAVFSVGCDYTLDVYEKKYTVHITARKKNTVSFTCDMLKANRPEDTRIFTAPITIDTESKSEIIYLLGDCRADNPDPVQEIHAETREITPEPQTYWENLLAENPNSIVNFTWNDFYRDNSSNNSPMHQKLRANIHHKICTHNFALVDACQSHDDIRQLLAGVTEPALIGIMEHTADYFGTCGGYHEKDMASIPYMIDLLIKRIDYCREDKAYWTEVKKRKTQQQHKSRNPESNPASATVHADIEHKLIDTKELHFADKRKALDHNAAVITSCMFQEAVISLLMSISAKAVIQLGFHMGLFIAKPKGSKKAIAEAFAERLIARRDIHANVRANTANTYAKNTPDVPDGVKFFVGARRQICFKFED